jgi:hypothetical protein
MPSKQAKEILLAYERDVYNPGKNDIRDDVWAAKQDYLLSDALDRVHKYLREKVIRADEKSGRA